MSAEVRISELLEDLRDYSLKVLIVPQDICRAQRSNIFWNLLHRLRKNVSFVCDVYVESNVVWVLFWNFSVHFSIVVWLIFAAGGIWVQQMFFRLEILIDFSVHLDVLHSTMEYNQDFCINCPIVKVWNKSLEYEFKRG